MPPNVFILVDLNIRIQYMQKRFVQPLFGAWIFIVLNRKMVMVLINAVRLINNKIKSENV